MISQVCHRIDYGDVPTWIAAAAAIVAGFYAARVYRTERRRDRQVTQVAVWSAIQGGLEVCYIHNGSQLPIGDVNVYAHSIANGRRAAYRLDLDLVPPQTRGWVRPRDAKAGEEHAFAISFRDGAGDYFWRDDHGAVHRGRMPHGENDALWQRRDWVAEELT